MMVSDYSTRFENSKMITPDIDIFIRLPDKTKFIGLYKELKKSNFWCINTDKPDKTYDYLKHEFIIRFSERNTIIPNLRMRVIEHEMA